jgi:hypothetical protein
MSALIAMMMEATRTSETLVNFYQTTRCYNLEDSHLRYYYRTITVIDFYCCHSPNNSTSLFPDYAIPTFFCVLNTFLYLICDWQSMKSLLEADVIDWLSITSRFHIRTYKCDWPNHIQLFDSIHSHLSREYTSVILTLWWRWQWQRTSRYYWVSIVDSTF